MSSVMTVRGPISADELGITMCHVHLLIELGVAEQKILLPEMTASEKALYDKPVTIDILGKIRRNYYCVKDDLILGDVNVAIEELLHYKGMGGGSVVEAGVIGIRRDPLGLKQISNVTGIHVICSTGWYIGASHPAYVKQKSRDELCHFMVQEIQNGIGNTGIRAGLIKVALSGPTPDVPFTGDEEKTLRAAARAQSQTGAALTIHPCHHMGRARHWDTYLKILQDEGANLEKVYLSHMEFYAADTDYQQKLLDRGVTAAYDQFGFEEYVKPGVRKPSDHERVHGVVRLVEAGYVKQIVLSNEVVSKSHLKKYGGYGYSHVLENIVPDLKYCGVTQEQLNTMLIDNPRRLLPF